jgi:hypothetical protein
MPSDSEASAATHRQAPSRLKNPIEVQKLEDRRRLIAQAVDDHHAAILLGLLV